MECMSAGECASLPTCTNAHLSLYMLHPHMYVGPQATVPPSAWPSYYVRLFLF